MYQYRLIKEEQYNQEHGVYTAYGICGCELAQNVMRETIYLPDVFLSKTVAERFVALCNELELSLVHRPPGYEPDELPNCSTPRYWYRRPESNRHGIAPTGF